MNTEETPIRIGTRKSLLALAQANMLLQAFQSCGRACEIIGMDSLGDRRRDNERAPVRDKKEWIVDLEQALEGRHIDIAIHSGKDVPYDLHPGTEICSIFQREDPRDVFAGKIKNEKRVGFSDIRECMRIGTSSLRRKAFLLRNFPFTEILDLRGNVPTRLSRLHEGEELDGIILAAAGMKRLGLMREDMDMISETQMLPAMNQGILVVQFLKERQDIVSLCSPCVDAETQMAFLAERKCIVTLGADCQSSVGVLAKRHDKKGFTIQAAVLSPDGSSALQAEKGFDDIHSAERAGEELAQILISMGAERLLHATHA